MPAHPQMALASGAHVGPYEIVSPLGAGGMGEVYRARDTKLGREVALKILPESFVHDPERIARFSREAQVLASLNHPNIAAIHGLEDSTGVPALVMELVEGPTLADRIAQGPIPLAEALPIAKQIAEALEAAHEQGVIHRDLKPANVKVRADGTVKVLDFGLAKALDPVAAVAGDITASPTITTPAMTQMGMILGTAAYMSPEQAKGRPADKRSDIWAFGCVLYEMLTGRRAFEGEDVSDTLAAVLRGEPDWKALPPDTPPLIGRLLHQCLTKDRKARVPNISVARFDIADLLSGSTARTAENATSVARRSPLQRWLPFAATAAITGAIGAGVGWVWPRSVSQQVLRLTAMPIDGSQVGDRSPIPDVALTSDGQRIVYTTGQNPATQQLFVRSLDQLAAMPLKGVGSPVGPFLSPDGQWVGYRDAQARALKKVAITGGTPVTICPTETFQGGSWGSDGMIVFASSVGLFRVSDGGGTAEVVAKPDAANGELSYTFPEVLPGNRAVLFTIVPLPPRIDSGRIAVRDLKTGQIKVLVQGGNNAHYAPSGHLVYSVAGGLRAVRFDLDRLEVKGTPVPVVEGLATKINNGAASFAIAKNGALVYRTGDATVAQLRTLVWVDRHGHEEPLGVPSRNYFYPRLSPDGTKLALDIRDQENDIWVWDLVRHGPLTRLTVDPALNRRGNRGGVWSRDGKRIAFTAQHEGAENIYWQPADGSGTPERLTNGPGQQFPVSFTPDGTQLLFNEGLNTPQGLGVVNLSGDRHADILLHGSPNQNNGDISPDGKWLAYESNESGQSEIYVRPFPKVEEGRQQVSNGGGSRPVWARNGRELFYENAVPDRPAAKIMVVSVRLGATLTFGAPQVLVDGPYLTPQTGRTYDVTADGQRFVLIKDAPPTSPSSVPPRPSQLVVELNWLEELKARVPGK
jgi:serine/threonine-protein kinase